MSRRPLTFLAVGDLHIREKDLKRCREMCDAILLVVKTEKPNRVVLMGDTLHSFKLLNAYCLELAIKFFKELAALSPTDVLIGNHDRPSHNEFLTDAHPFHGVDNVPGLRIVWTSIAEWFDDIGGYIVWMPYVQKGRHDEALEKATIIGGPANGLESSFEEGILCEFSHGEYKGAIMDGHVSKTGDPWGDEKHPNVSGHIHEHQYLGLNTKISPSVQHQNTPTRQISGIVYVGTPIQTIPSESEYKTVSLITIPPKATKSTSTHRRFVYERRIPLGCTVIKTREVTYDEMMEWKIEDQEADEYGRKIQWRLIIKDHSSKFASLSIVPQYDELLSQGVLIQTEPIADSIDERHISDSKRDITYMSGLLDRIKNNPDQTRLLLSLLSGMVTTK